MRFRERWRGKRPELVVLAGSAIGAGGNAAWLAWVLASEPRSMVAVPLAVTTTALALCALPPILLRRSRPHLAMRFGIAGIAASIVVLLTPPGVIGGGIALAGAVWGLLTTDASTDA